MADLTVYRPLAEFQREVDRLLEGFFPTPNGHTSVWAPPADIWETDEAYVFAFDLPGLTKEQVDITLQEGMLQIAGERRVNDGEQTQYHRMERRHGRFFRSLRLPRNVDAGGIHARFHDGVLTIEVPKREESKPRRIEVS